MCRLARLWSWIKDALDKSKGCVFSVAYAFHHIPPSGGHLLPLMSSSNRCPIWPKNTIRLLRAGKSSTKAAGVSRFRPGAFHCTSTVDPERCSFFFVDAVFQFHSSNTSLASKTLWNRVSFEVVHTHVSTKPCFKIIPERNEEFGSSNALNPFFNIIILIMLSCFYSVSLCRLAVCI